MEESIKSGCCECVSICWDVDGLLIAVSFFLCMKRRGKHVHTLAPSSCIVLFADLRNRAKFGNVHQGFSSVMKYTATCGCLRLLNAL